MCTAISFKTKHHYFGRNLDLERGYGECVTITPRHAPLSFRYLDALSTHYAMIGMAVVVDDYPLYFEATNEKGLSMAGLNFPGNTLYYDYDAGKENVAPFEFIPYLLSVCTNVTDVRKKLAGLNIVQCNFSEDLPATPLHWMISDKEASITLECTKDGMHVYDNPYGVLTNNPPFGYHLHNINNYQSLHEGAATNSLNTTLPLENYSLGMGAMHLPGDFSSASRFVKAVFVKEKSICDGSEKESVNQFFHILQSVAMPNGCVLTSGGAYEYTRYSCCCNTNTQVYYYTTYQNIAIRKIDMNDVPLDAALLYLFPMES